MKYTLYMLKDEHYDKLFMNYGYAMANGGVNMDEYEPVYSGTIESLRSIPDMLESLFALFNCSHPANYRGRSMSVSDIVVLEDGTAWFCDSMGFKNIQTPAAPWAAYCQYLHDWADAHADKGFEGCCPVCYDEFLECEYNEEE